jgi:hypothetical protein
MAHKVAAVGPQSLSIEPGLDLGFGKEDPTMNTFKMLNVWTAERTLPLQLAVRLIAMFRFTGRPHAYAVHAGPSPTVTVTFEMATLS